MLAVGVANHLNCINFINAGFATHIFVLNVQEHILEKGQKRDKGVPEMKDYTSFCYVKDRDDLMEVIPQTYGEAIQLFPWIKCESHEWDNRTTIENAIWLIRQIREYPKPAVARKPKSKEIWEWAAKVFPSQPANTGERPE